MLRLREHTGRRNWKSPEDVFSCFNKAACDEDKVSLDNHPEEHVLVGFGSGLNLAWRGTRVAGYLSARVSMC